MSKSPVHITTDEVHAHPRKTGHSSFDLIMASMAIFISLLSLFVAIEHGKAERDLVAANSWPFLREIRTQGESASGEEVIGVSNGGVGPAKLKWFEVYYDHRPMASNLDLLRRCCDLSSDEAAVVRQLPRGLGYTRVDDTVLRPGEQARVMRVLITPDAPQIPDRFEAAQEKITFRACYCSILDECWISDLRTTKTEPVKACPVPDHPFDPNAR